MLPSAVSILIGIAGGSGSGKTFLARQIRDETDPTRVAVLSMDQYFRSDEMTGDSEDVNFDHPKHLDFDLMLRHIRRLKQGKRIKAPSYDFHKRKQTAQALIVEPRPIIIVEGLFVLAEPAVRLFDLTCFLKVDSDQRLLGRILRDVSERGANVEAVIDRYQRFVRPSYQVFVAPTAENADVVVDFTYRRTFFSKMLVHIVRDALTGGYDISELVAQVRSENVRVGFRPEQGAMPFSIDIFTLARDYPEEVLPGRA